MSDVSWLTLENAYFGPEVGWIRVGHKGVKIRDIDLLNEASRPLHGCLNLDKEHGSRTPEGPFSVPDSGEEEA